jgi:CPA2 family monovalent cation:H+ antiporter-2
VIIGYGRVGSAIGKALEDWNLPFVVVERDRRRVDPCLGQQPPRLMRVGRRDDDEAGGADIGGLQDAGRGGVPEPDP